MEARPLVEGALLAALTVLMTLIGNYIPLLSLLLMFTPAPLALVALRHGTKAALISLAASTLILAAVLGLQLQFFAGTALAASGIPMGLGARNGWKVTLTLALAALLLALSSSVTLFGTAFLTGINPMTEYIQAQSQSTEMIEGLIKRYPALDNPQLRANLEAQKQGSALLQQSLAAILGPLIVVGALFAAVVEYALVRWLLRRLRVDLPPVPPFRTWRVPAEVALLGVPALLVQLLGQGRLSPELVGGVTMGTLALLSPLYMVSGIALAFAMLMRMKMPPGAAGLLLFVAFPLVGYGLLIVGLIDSFMDFRLMLEQAD